MQSIFKFSLLLLSFFFLYGCEKDPDLTPAPAVKKDLKITLHYNADGLPLIFDSIMYTNAAGNNYSVTQLKYYISNITFHSTSLPDLTLDNIYYVDAQDASTNTITIDNVPPGSYEQITLNIGLDSAHNKDYFLPNTNENINMAWPTSMGGGYHFMKFEGNYVYTPSTFGFTMHLGKNSSLVTCLITKPFVVSYTASTQLKLNMNLNEWFKNPIMYDFNTDGNFTMGNMQAMGKIAANGIDVFSME